MISSDKLKFLKFWFPAFFYSGIIFYVSGLPGSVIPPQINLFDKLCHVAEYMGLGFLTGRAMKGTAGFPSKKVRFLVVLFCFFYGLSDEFHQMFVPGRDFSFGDVAADAIGGLLGSLWIR